MFQDNTEFNLAEILAPSIALQPSGRVRLQAAVNFFDGEKLVRNLMLYYEVDEEYGQYLCAERADAFLVVLLPLLMEQSSKNGGNVSLRIQAPVSERLYYQLTTYYMPTLESSLTNRAHFTIDCILENTVLPSANAVGTGISGGVDSFYTLLKHSAASKHYKVTHGVYGNYMLYGNSDSAAENAHQNAGKKICEETGIKYLCVTTNTCVELYEKAYPPIVACLFSALPLALQKLFSTYYFSSSIPFTHFFLDDEDSTHYDLLNTYCLSNQNLTFYSTGSEVSRIEKTDFISNFPVTHAHLRVCIRPDEHAKNCGRCGKCTRTMLQLYALDKLDLYKDSFDLDFFYKNPNYYFGYFLYSAKKDMYYKETRATMKQNGKPLPKGARLAAVGKWFKLRKKHSNQ